MIRNPQVTLYSSDLPRALAFYTGLRFRETFRYPESGPRIHVELLLDGFNLGIVDIAVAAEEHGLRPNLGGNRAELVVWTDDTDALFARLTAAGAPVLSAPHDWLGRLRVAWVTDPDGTPIQLAQGRDATV